jgi:hypothetical protein
MSFDVFEEEGGAAGFRFGVAVEAGLRGAVGDLGDFEKWVDFFADAAKFAVFVEDFDPVSEVVAGQVGLSGVGSFLTIERDHSVSEPVNGSATCFGRVALLWRVRWRL